MNTILRGIPGIICFIDILVTGTNDEDLDRYLFEVLLCLHQHEMRMKKAKCEFPKTSPWALHQARTQGGSGGSIKPPWIQLINHVL